SISRTIAARTSHIQARTDTESDTDSHGVSDPSGHARDGIERANRGRSRHGVLCWRLLLRLQGRHRAPPVESGGWLLCREVAREQAIVALQGGWLPTPAAHAARSLSKRSGGR